MSFLEFFSSSFRLFANRFEEMTAKDATANTHTTYRVSYTTFQNLKFSYMYSEKKEVLQNITLSAGTVISTIASRETSYFILFKWSAELQISKLLEPRLLFDCCLFWPTASIEKTTVCLCVCLVHTWVGTEKSVSFAHLGCHHRVQHDKWSGSLEQNIYAENSRFIKAFIYGWDLTNHQIHQHKSPVSQPEKFFSYSSFSQGECMLLVRMNGFVSIFVGCFKNYA